MKKILIFGDSHTYYYNIKNLPSNHIITSSSILGYKVERIGFPGASVRGFRNKAKSTLNLTDTIIESIGSNDIVVLAFGQVDIELGIYYRRFIKNSKETPSKFIEDCIESYKNLIQTAKKKSKYIIIKGINMPVMIDKFRAIEFTKQIITENQEMQFEIEESYKKLQQGLPDIFKRISMAEEFNQSLQKLCIDFNIEYFDINNYICYPNGIVKEEFITSNIDIHLIGSLKTRQIHFTALGYAVKNSLSNNSHK